MNPLLEKYGNRREILPQVIKRLWFKPVHCRWELYRTEISINEAQMLIQAPIVPRGVVTIHSIL